MTDVQIIEAVQKGGIEMERAMSWFYSQVKIPIISWLGNIIRQPLEEVELHSVFNDSFTAFRDALLKGNFRQESSLKTYLARICRNKAIDAGKKALKQNRWLVLDSPDSLNLGNTPDVERMENEQLMGKLDELLARIIDNSNWRKIFLLKAQDLTYEDIAKKTNLTVKSCINANYQAKKILSVYFKENPGKLFEFKKLMS